MADYLEPGCRLARYEIIGLLRHDATGVEYEATVGGGQESVLIREYLPDGLVQRPDGPEVSATSDDVQSVVEAGLAHFIGHYGALRRVRHPTVVGVRECVRAFGTGYAVMELVPGESLSDRLSDAKRLTPEELQGILVPLVDGLGILHRINVLHRAIEPNNIVVRADGSPVLRGVGMLDAPTGGARRAFAWRPRAFIHHLAPGYAALEQYSGRGQQGPWTDIYALGAVAYRCVTGAAPLDAPGRAVQDDLVPAARAAKGAYDSRLLAGIDAALGLRVADRPRSVAAWRPVLSTRAAERGPRSSSRRRIAARQSRPSEAVALTPAFRKDDGSTQSGPRVGLTRRLNWALPALAATVFIALLTWLDAGLLRSGGARHAGADSGTTGRVDLSRPSAGPDVSAGMDGVAEVSLAGEIADVSHAGRVASLDEALSNAEASTPNVSPEPLEGIGLARAIVAARGPEPRSRAVRASSNPAPSDTAPPSGSPPSRRRPRRARSAPPAAVAGVRTPRPRSPPWRGVV